MASPAAIAAHGGPPLTPDSQKSHGTHIALLAEGVVPLSFVLPPPQIPPPPSGAPALEARLRITFPIRRSANALAIQVYFVPQGLPVLPLPEAPPLVPDDPTDPVTISYFEVDVVDLQLGDSPVAGSAQRLRSFTLTGRVTANPVPSPFGDLTGAPCVVSASFHLASPRTGETDFVFLTSMVAGNHVTVAPTGKGLLRLKR